MYNIPNLILLLLNLHTLIYTFIQRSISFCLKGCNGPFTLLYLRRKNELNYQEIQWLHGS